MSTYLQIPTAARRLFLPHLSLVGGIMEVPPSYFNPLIAFQGLYSIIILPYTHCLPCTILLCNLVFRVQVHAVVYLM